MKKALSMAALAVLLTAGSARIQAGNPTNQCPSALPQSVDLLANTGLDFDVHGSDPDGDTLSFILGSPPSHGGLTFSTNSGECAYTPANGYCGPDSFTFMVSDGNCISTPATVDIDIHCTNRCPTAGSFSINVDQDSMVSFNLQGSDSDNDPLQHYVNLPPLHGTLVVGTATGSATYTPNAGYCGPDSFKYYVYDGICPSQAATVSIDVACQPQNRCPTADSSSAAVEQGSSVNLQLSGSDSDGDSITYVVTQPAAHGVVVLNVNTGAASYTPNVGYCGPDMFAFTVHDGMCESGPAIISISVACVTPVNIDIKPGGSPNSFKCGSSGVVPIAILGSATFNVNAINKATVKLQTAGALVSPQLNGTKIKDINGDGRPDLTLQFSSPAISAGIGCPLPVNPNIQLKLKGTTLSGVNFAGTDFIRIVSQ